MHLQVDEVENQELGPKNGPLWAPKIPSESKSEFAISPPHSQFLESLNGGSQMAQLQTIVHELQRVALNSRLSPQSGR